MSRPYNKQTAKLSEIGRNQETAHLNAMWEAELDPGPGTNEKKKKKNW